MIARGFKPVVWVAAVGGAALSCYMLSLNVAAERAELAAVERQIIMAKRDIRGLQTELGTRGRLQQLEHWNADVLALSAPASGQFLQDELTLARYVEPQKSFEEQAKVRLASAEEPAAAQPSIAPRLASTAPTPAQAKVAPAVSRSFNPAPAAEKPMVRRASLVAGEVTPFVPAKAAPAKAAAVKVPKMAEAKPTPVKSAPAKSAAKPEAAKKAPTKVAGLIGDSLAREIVEASKAEARSGGAATR